MAAPTVTGATKALYRELPEHYRTADEQQGWPLLRWLDVLGHQVAEINTIRRQVADGVLGRPADAPTEWLRWMAQFVALDTTGLTPPEVRVGIASGQSLLNGSLASLERTVEALLGGQKRYMIVTHDGNPWTITVYAHVDDAGGTTWDQLALDYPSWDAWETAPSWDDLATVAPLADRPNLAAVTPAWIVLNVDLLANGNTWLFLEQAVTSWDQWEAEFATWDDLEGADFAWQ